MNTDTYSVGKATQNRTAEIGHEALEFFFNASGKLFAILDRSGAVKRANISLRRFLGPASASDDASIFSFMSQQQADAIRQDLEALDVNETVSDLNIDFQVGWSNLKVVADVTLAESGDFLFIGSDVTQAAAKEQESHEANANLDHLEEVIGIGRWRMYKQGPSQWSDGMYRLYDMDPEEGVPDFASFSQAISEQDQKRLRMAIRRCYRMGEAVSLTYLFTTRNGEARTLEVAGSPSFDQDGAVNGIHGVTVDKTSSVRALQSAMQTESTVRGFLDNAPMAIAVFDEDMRFMLVSRKWGEISGFDGQDVIGRRVDQVLSNPHPDLIASFGQALRGEVTSRERHEYEIDGKMYCLRWSMAPWYDDENVIRGVIFTYENITDLADAQRRVESSYDRMKFALDMSSMMVWEFNLRDRTYNVDGDWRAFHPQKPTLSYFIRGMNALVHEDDIDDLKCQWQRLMDQGSSFRVKYRMTNPAGREVWVGSEVRMERTPDGKPWRIIGTMRDITHARRSELSIKEAEERASLANVAKSEFISRIGYEVSKPLESMLSVTEALQRMGMEQRQKDMVRLVEASGRVVLDLMADIQEYTVLEANQIEFDIAPFDLREMLEAALANQRASADDKGVMLGLTCSDEADGVFRADGHRIREVMVNLIKDSIRQNQDTNVSIDVDVEKDDEGLGLLLIAMTDEAQPETQMESASIAQNMPMSIVTRLVQMMKGSVEFSQALDGQRLVRVEIPLTWDANSWQSERDSRRRAEQDGDQNSLQGRKMLVAEDNPLKRRVLALILDAAGLESTYVENGEEAVEAIRYGSFDAVLMDVQMPIMDGVKATRAIRAWEKENAAIYTPIIAVSAHSNALKIKEAMDAGADDFLPKPVTPEQIIECLSKRMVGRPRVKAA